MSNSLIPEWITAISTAVGALAVVAGLFLANRKLNETLETRRLTKRAEAAEKLIVLAHRIQYAMNDVRNPFYNIPVAEVNNDDYRYKKYWEAVDEYSDLFNGIHEAEIHAGVILNDNDDYENVKTAVGGLLRVRFRILSAITRLKAIEADKEDKREYQDELKTLRRTAYNIDSENNEISQDIERLIKTIEDHLAPIARMEEGAKT